MRPLVLCQSCKQHIKAHEASCPFCGSAARPSVAPAATSPRGRPGGRAALFLAGAALATGCGDDADSDDDSSMVIPAYGIAIDRDAGRDAARDAWMPAPPYGISIDPPLDAGPSCERVGNLPVPVYGIGIDAPPQDVCTDAAVDAGDAGDASVDARVDAGVDARVTVTTTPYGIAPDPER